MSDRIVDAVKDFILQTIVIGVMEDPLSADDSFLQKGILDSTGVLELVGFLERQYGIACADHEITPENLDTLNAIARFVQRKLNGQPTSAT
ncbi:MAG: acyl carrier protein [Acidobacteria bacterium]|nr:acyl carrier protein [Acidobacteriota bacterium]MCI0621734.1 acyl carrier protein [Acidobacteriota bacterium]MCI0718378.1 acyl carrier protein [Acidobacteriota bacterium]